MASAINGAGIDLVRDFEGLSLRAYKCPAGIWTCGFGATGPDIGPETVFTKAQAEARLDSDLKKFAAGVRKACKVKPNANQLAAMTSLAFNIGIGAFQKSTVLKRHNAGDTEAAAKAFGMWNKATVGGKKVVLPGLVSRRAREAALYLKAAKPADRTPMPQAVADEPRVSISGDVITAAGGAAGGATAPLAKVTEIAQQASEVGWTMQTLLDLGPWVILALIALGAGGYFIWRKYQRRKQGVE